VFLYHKSQEPPLASFYDLNTRQITVAWHDETSSSQCFDFVYRYIRLAVYGRTVDVESFSVCNIGYFFAGSFTDAQDMNAMTGLHKTATIPFRWMKTLGDTDRPIVYIRTWNHSFSYAPPYDYTPGDWCVFDKEPLAGSRDDAIKFAKNAICSMESYL